MQRRTAILLLLLALVGTFVPVALAVTAASPHACCLRAAHKCHAMAGESEQLAFRSTGCCNHDCCRAVTTAQWAHVQAGTAGSSPQNLDARIVEAQPLNPAAVFSASESTRAPPQISIA